MAEKKKLDWDCNSDITYGLYTQHPKMTKDEILALSDEQIIEKILALPGFAGEAKPPEDSMPKQLRETWAFIPGPKDWKDWGRFTFILSKQFPMNYDEVCALTDKQIIEKARALPGFIGKESSPESYVAERIRDVWKAYVPLRWEDWETVAEVLFKNYVYSSVKPDQFSDEQLLAKVNELPGFAGEKIPPETGVDYLALIRKRWNGLLGQHYHEMERFAKECFDSRYDR